MTHRMSSREACSLVIMSGMAMFTIVRSSRVMKNPSDTTSSTAHGLPRYFLTVPPYATRRAAPLHCRHAAQHRLGPGQFRYVRMLGGGTDKTWPAVLAARVPGPWAAAEGRPGCSGHEIGR